MERKLAVWCARVGLVAVISLGVVACGGGDRLSEAEFRDRAEAICKQVEETNVAQPSDQSDLVRYLEDFLQVIDGSAEDFHALRPPEAFQEQWDEYLRLVDEAVSLLQDFRDRAGDASTVELLQIAERFETEVERLADRGRVIERDLGLDECIN